MLLLLLAGLSLACLPKLLLGALVIALFLFILWLIISKVVPAEFQSTAKWVLLVVLLIVLLVVLIQLYSEGLSWVC